MKRSVSLKHFPYNAFRAVVEGMLLAISPVEIAAATRAVTRPDVLVRRKPFACVTLLLQATSSRNPPTGFSR
jgi:hypothetical protein